MSRKAKQAAAAAALELLPEDCVLGVGTGSTVECLIEYLPSIRNKLTAVIASSQASAEKLKACGFAPISFNEVTELPYYIDGADAFNDLGQLIKGAGGALTGEKILAYPAETFICIVDAAKRAHSFLDTPVPVEVIPDARSCVARALVKLGGRPIYRVGFITDHGHCILDVTGLDVREPIALEQRLNQIPGVVSHGLFAMRPADFLVIGDKTDTQCLKTPL